MFMCVAQRIMSHCADSGGQDSTVTSKLQLKCPNTLFFSSALMFLDTFEKMAAGITSYILESYFILDHVGMYYKILRHTLYMLLVFGCPADLSELSCQKKNLLSFT